MRARRLRAAEVRVGVHRVQRVPDTETQGRVHTSAATVAVLPEAQDVDIDINEADLKSIRCARKALAASTSTRPNRRSALPICRPDTIVFVQDERSQHKNRARAMALLRSRLYEHPAPEIDAERAADRQRAGRFGRSLRTHPHL